MLTLHGHPAGAVASADECAVTNVSKARFIPGGSDRRQRVCPTPAPGTYGSRRSDIGRQGMPIGGHIKRQFAEPVFACRCRSQAAVPTAHPQGLDAVCALAVLPVLKERRPSHEEG